MKKLISILLLMISVSCFGQDSLNHNIQKRKLPILRFIPRVGWNSYKFSGWEDQPSHPGLVVGGSLGTLLRPNFMVEVSLFYHRVAARTNGYYGTENDLKKSTFCYHLDYIRMPIMFCSTGSSKVNNGFVFEDNELNKGLGLSYKLGIYLGYGINGNTKVNIEDNGFEKKFSGNVFNHDSYFGNAAFTEDGKKFYANKFDRFDVGLSAGIELWILKVVLEMCFDYSLKRTYSDVTGEKCRAYGAYMTVGIYL